MSESSCPTHLNPGTGLRLRPMGVADLDAVIAIAASLPTAPQWPRSAYQEAVVPTLPVPRLSLTAVRDEAVLGFAIARITGPVAELETIVIAASAQGYGFGSSLLYAVREELRLLGVAELELEVRPSNTLARQFYLGQGFVEAGRRRNYYRNPIEDALLLRLALSAS